MLVLIVDNSVTSCYAIKHVYVISREGRPPPKLPKARAHADAALAPLLLRLPEGDAAQAWRSRLGWVPSGVSKRTCPDRLLTVRLCHTGEVQVLVCRGRWSTHHLHPLSPGPFSSALLRPCSSTTSASARPIRAVRSRAKKSSLGKLGPDSGAPGLLVGASRRRRAATPRLEALALKTPNFRAREELTAIHVLPESALLPSHPGPTARLWSVLVSHDVETQHFKVRSSSPGMLACPDIKIPSKDSQHKGLGASESLQTQMRIAVSKST